MPQHAAPPLSAAEAATVFRFEAAPDADESLRMRVAVAIRLALMDDLASYEEMADAAISVMRGEA